MVQFAAALLRGVIAMFAGLLFAGGTLVLAADHAPIDRPSLVAVSPPSNAQATLTVPDVTGQAYVFAKGILQDRGFAWHVTGPVMGYAANTVELQTPAAGTIVLDTGAPLVTLTLARNAAYVEKGTPENDAPYPATAVRLPANVPQRPKTSVTPKLQPVPVPVTPAPKPTTPAEPTAVPAPTETTTPATTTPAATTPAKTTPTPVSPGNAPLTPAPATTTPKSTTPATKTAKPATSAPKATAPAATTPLPTSTSGPRTPDFQVAGAPKEPARSLSLPQRVAALSTFVNTHRSPTAANLNHWLYENAYIVAGARFGWWHGAQALSSLIAVDTRAEKLWGVGNQSRTAAEKALAEVRARGA